MTSFRRIDTSRQHPTPPDEFGAPPMLQWVDVADLVIDDRYQRPLGSSNWRAIERIAAGFCWSKFSPVFAAPVEGGKFAIVDGQHRTHAAAMVGIEAVPCQIVQMSSPEQAAAFAAVNGETTAITIWNIYKAALAAGEDWATRCRDAVEAAGCDLMTANRSHKDKRTGEVYCVGTIRRAVAAGQDRAVTAALRGLRVSASGEGPELWNARVVEPWINALAERPALVERRRPEEIAGVIDATDIWAVLDRVTAFIANRRRAGTPCASFRDLLQAELGTLLDKAFLANTIRAAE